MRNLKICLLLFFSFCFCHNFIQFVSLELLTYNFCKNEIGKLEYFWLSILKYVWHNFHFLFSLFKCSFIFSECTAYLNLIYNQPLQSGSNYQSVVDRIIFIFRLHCQFSRWRFITSLSLFSMMFLGCIVSSLIVILIDRPPFS